MDILFHKNNVIIVLAVVLFVLILVAGLVIVDHKARIPGVKKDDLFSIVGKRGSHPIWAWMISALVLWVTISVLFTGWIWGMFNKVSGPLVVPKLVTKLEANRRAERLRHFHNMPASEPWAEGGRPVCIHCHGDFPHFKQPMIRTLMNMHTQFIGCLTCHYNAEKVPEETVTLRWLNYTGIAVSGPPFGTDIDPKTGTLLETDDFYSKIVPYQMLDGKERLVEIPDNSPDAREFLKIKESLSPNDKEAMKKSFHREVNPIGRFCNRCHAPEEKSMIPFRALGFSDRRIANLTNLNIIGIVEKYREFYLPTILNRYDRDIPGAKPVVDMEAVKPLPVSDEILSDPRSWWRKSFQKPTKPKSDHESDHGSGSK